MSAKRKKNPRAEGFREALEIVRKRRDDAMAEDEADAVVPNHEPGTIAYLVQAQRRARSHSRATALQYTVYELEGYLQAIEEAR